MEAHGKQMTGLLPCLLLETVNAVLQQGITLLIFGETYRDSAITCSPSTSVVKHV
ncbi:hypothetical protein PENDEC_c008G03959 [Penicillium decumbens]|uniref:Uncharacterized protein n=1 Tax=Penicillium decumbens TaxID=69771 RepID=A0A1V6PDQ0_PENDC|nr:hypothetical protein PENDEC_c008G03959 [Penicillium decumbens]